MATDYEARSHQYEDDLRQQQRNLRIRGVLLLAAFSFLLLKTH